MKLGNVKPFLDHMTLLFPDEGDGELVLDYLALLTQKPAQKIHFALLVCGSQGTGKSWIGNLMERIIGRPNVVRPSNALDGGRAARDRRGADDARQA